MEPQGGRQFQASEMTRDEQHRFALAPAMPHGADGMDDVPGRQQVSFGGPCLYHRRAIRTVVMWHSSLRMRCPEASWIVIDTDVFRVESARVERRTTIRVDSRNGL